MAKSEKQSYDRVYEGPSLWQRKTWIENVLR